MPNPKVRASFFGGSVPEGELQDLDLVLGRLKEARQRLRSLSVDQIIEVLDEFASRLLDRNNELHRKYPGAGIPYIASWARRANLERLLDSSLGDRRHLDQFVDNPSRPDRAFAAFPRGIILHWMAGNVPTLGFLSLLQGLLTKNANVIKVASNQNDMLDSLLMSIQQVLSDKGSGTEVLLEATAVLRFSHTEKAISQALSKEADVRVLWGSDESVAQIRRLPTKLETQDVVFPNRTSLIVIGALPLQQSDIERLCRRIAMDVSIFEQKACASPHTIFIESPDEDQVDRFAKALLKGLTAALRSVPKSVPSEKEVAAILNLRAQYDMFHKAWYSKGTEFTILSDDKFQLGPPIGNRTIFLRKTPDLAKVADLIDSKVQSVGIALSPDQYDHLTHLFGSRGVHRFIPVGNMTHFEMPWDGFFLPQSLVRWTSRPARLKT